MKIKLDSASDTVDDIRATPCPMSSSEVVNAYGSFSMESVWSLNLPLITSLSVTKRERRTIYTQLINKEKSEQLILSKTYPSM
jgi:hypothetical protein